MGEFQQQSLKRKRSWRDEGRNVKELNNTPIRPTQKIPLSLGWVLNELISLAQKNILSQPVQKYPHLLVISPAFLTCLIPFSYIFHLFKNILSHLWRIKDFREDPGGDAPIYYLAKFLLKTV